MSNREAIHEVLRKAFQIEVDGYTFYSMTAEKAQNSAVQELFAKLAQDEVQHQAFLRQVMQHYDERGATAFSLGVHTPEMRAFTQHIFTDRFRQQAQGASFETAVLSIGMTLESNAIAYFSNAAEGSAETVVREFFEFLADWERQHLDALQTLFNSVRSDFWAESGFAPF